MGRRPQLSLVLFFYSFLTGALNHEKHIHNHHQVHLPMYAVGKKGWNSIENCFRKFRKKYTDGGMCLNIVSIVYFTLYFSIKYITQIALDKNSSLAKSWSKLNTKRKLDLVDPLPNGLAMASMMLLPRDLNKSFRKTHQIKIILHRIISVVWLTNFLSEIWSLSSHDDEV